MICITIAIGGYLVYKKFFAKKRINETESKTTNLNVNNETNNNIQEPIADSKTQGYETSKSIVTETEKMFYKRLVIYCSPKMYTVNMKTRLEDLVEYSKGMSFAEKQKYRGQIKSRHVDFLIVDSELKPVFAIELDDNSHLKQKAMETDKFKDELFQKIGIPLYRIPADESIWNIELDRIFEKIGNTQN